MSEKNLNAAVTKPENMYWAWRKAKRMYAANTQWTDMAEVAAFESDLDSNLTKIREQLASGSYTMSPLRPLARPKQPDDEGNSRARQEFSVRVADQVAWIAFVNIVGPHIDFKMPSWSYGYRLYRTVWVEEEDGRKIVKTGWYRHTSGHLYRKFKQSWPLYRRHISLTARTMGRKMDPEELDEGERQVWDTEQELRESMRLPYLERNYWTSKAKNIFWGSVDLSKFFPASISTMFSVILLTIVVSRNPK